METGEGVIANENKHAGFFPALFLLALFLGSGYVWISIALDWLGEVEIALCQVLIGSATLYGFIGLRGGSVYLSRKEWRQMAILGVFANVGPSLLIPWAERSVDAGAAGITNATTPLFVLCISSFLGVEHLSASKVAGFVLGFIGVVLVGAPWTGAGGSLIHFAALLLAAGSYAIAYVYAGRVLSRTPRTATLLAAAQLLSAAVILVPISALLLLVFGSGFSGGSPPVDAVLAVCALGIGTIGIGYALNYRLLIKIGPLRTSVVTYLIPVVALCLGIVLLGETATWNLLVGGAVVMIGIAIAERGSFGQISVSAGSALEHEQDEVASG